MRSKASWQTGRLSSYSDSWSHGHGDKYFGRRCDKGRFCKDFRLKKEIEASWSEFKELSIGMSGDYLIAIEYGATIVRVGHKIFTVENE